MLEPSRSSLRLLIERQLLELNLDRSIFIAGFCYFGEFSLLISETLIALVLSLSASSTVPSHLKLACVPFVAVASMYVLIVLDITSNPRPPMVLEKELPTHILEFLMFSVVGLLCF